MRLIIAGSRTVTSQLWVNQAAAWALGEWRLVPSPLGFAPLRDYIYRAVTEVVSGGARGADMLGECLAKEYGVHVHRMRADWTRLGRAAGLVRNRAMAEYAAAGEALGLGRGGLVAVWDGTSTGTKNMIQEAEARGLRTYVRVVPK